MQREHRRGMAAKTESLRTASVNMASLSSFGRTTFQLVATACGTGAVSNPLVGVLSLQASPEEHIHPTTSFKKQLSGLQALSLSLSWRAFVFMVPR